MRFVRFFVGLAVVALFVGQLVRGADAELSPEIPKDRKELAAYVGTYLVGILEAVPELTRQEETRLEAERIQVETIKDTDERLQRKRALSVSRESLTKNVRGDFEFAFTHLQELREKAFPPETEVMHWLAVERTLRFRCTSLQLLAVCLVREHTMTETVAARIFDGGQAIGWSYGMHGRCNVIMDRCVVPLVEEMRVRLEAKSK